MKQVVQLDANGYFLGTTVADESPLEPGVYLFPAHTIEAEVPQQQVGYVAKWIDGWVYEPEIIVPEEKKPEPFDFDSLTYDQKRAIEYPPMQDYLDGVVKGDQVQINKYIADCLAVKAKYPKP